MEEECGDISVCTWKSDENKQIHISYFIVLLCRIYSHFAPLIASYDKTMNLHTDQASYMSDDEHTHKHTEKSQRRTCCIKTGGQKKKTFKKLMYFHALSLRLLLM